MLYYITKEIVQAAENGDTKVTDVLEHIAMAHLQGRHFVMSSRELLKRLINVEKYNDRRTANIYKYILSKYATYGSIVHIIRLKVVFILSDIPYIEKDENGRYKEIGCPINAATFDLLINETGLLFENIKEGGFYHFMSEFYKKKQFLLTNTRYTILNGGGDTTKNVLQEISESKERFCLSFLDSDKKHPDASIGDTLKGVIKTRKKTHCYYTSDYIYTDKYREVENMIPLDVLQIISREDPNWLKGVKDINAIQKNDEDTYYYDVKNGINQEKYVSLEESKQKEYVSRHIMLAREISKEELESMTSSSSSKKTILLFGAGSHVLENAISFYKANFLQWVENATLPTRLEQEWMRMGEEIIVWTCASSPIRI